jgi:hypothetical protein
MRWYDLRSKISDFIFKGGFTFFIFCFCDLGKGVRAHWYAPAFSFFGFPRLKALTLNP